MEVLILKRNGTKEPLIHILKTMILKITKIEYSKPDYKVFYDLIKNGKVIESNSISVGDSLDITEAKEIMKAKIQEVLNAESLGSKLNLLIGKDITL